MKDAIEVIAYLLKRIAELEQTLARHAQLNMVMAAELDKARVAPPATRSARSNPVLSPPQVNAIIEECERIVTGLSPEEFSDTFPPTRQN